MKQIVNCGGDCGGGGGRLRIPTEDEAEVAEILITLPKLLAKSEFISRYSFTWGQKKKRSALVSKPESSPSPSPSPLIKRRIVVTEKVTAVEDDKSPSTPLCFLPSGSGSDGGDKRKTPSSGNKSLKRKARDDLVESYNRMQQERETLLRETKAMKTLHQGLTSANLELKTIRQTVNYSRNIEDFQLRNNMFVPPTPPQHCNSQGSGRFGLFNQIDPRVKIHGEIYDFMGSSQPLDQNKYLVMDKDVRVRTAAAARKRRILRMKENKNASLALKLSSSGRR